MRVFENQFRDHRRFLTNSGSREKITYQARYNEKGQIILEEKGREDLYGYIQSFKDSVDIHVLLARFKNGDVEALNKVQGFYADITGMPTTFADALNVVHDAETFFASLPIEKRAEFHHNFAEFLAACDRPDNLARIFGGAVESDDVPVESVKDKEVPVNEP